MKANRKVDWKDVEDFIKWYMEDDHDFDVEIIYDKGREMQWHFIGFINTAARKSYTTEELFDYYLKYVK